MTVMGVRFPLDARGTTLPIAEPIMENTINDFIMATVRKKDN